MPRFIAVAVVFSAFAVLSSAQETTKWDPPKPPEGWKAVTSPDATYQFAFPENPPRSGTRDRNITIRGNRVRLQVNYCQAKDKTTLEIDTAILGGAAFKNTTVGDVIEAVVGAQRDDGFEVSAPKAVTIAGIKAREYRLTKDKLAARMAIFYARPRLFVLLVESDEADKLDGETANAFFKSLAIVPQEVLQARAKEKAAKAEQASKEHLEKYGFKWTTDLKDMTPPAAPVVGVVRGKEFKPDNATIYPGGRLVLRQGGDNVFADVQVELLFLAKGRESVENKTFEVAAAARNPAGSPTVRVAAKVEGEALPKSDSFSNRYALKLMFGTKDAEGNVPGTVYLCTPDKSFLAGQFMAKSK